MAAVLGPCRSGAVRRRLPGTLAPAVGREYARALRRLSRATEGTAMRGLHRFVWRASASRQIVLIVLALAAAVLAVAPLELQRPRRRSGRGRAGDRPQTRRSSRSRERRGLCGNLQFATPGIPSQIRADVPDKQHAVDRGLCTPVFRWDHGVRGETEIGIVVAFISGLDRVLDPWRELIAFVRSTSAAKVQSDLIESTLGRQL